MLAISPACDVPQIPVRATRWSVPTAIVSVLAFVLAEQVIARAHAEFVHELRQQGLRPTGEILAGLLVSGSLIVSTFAIVLALVAGRRADAVARTLGATVAAAGLFGVGQTVLLLCVRPFAVEHSAEFSAMLGSSAVMLCGGAIAIALRHRAREA